MENNNQHHGFTKLESFLNRHDKLIISTHESPDWDGLGAEIALAGLLKRLGKHVLILNSDPINEDHTLIDPDNEIIHLTDNNRVPGDIGDYGHMVLDTNVYSNIGTAAASLEHLVRETFIIDHHEGKQDVIDSHFIKIEASSVCELIFQVYEYYDIEPDYKSVLAIYSGMVFDTGSFRYPKTSGETFRIASRLVNLGVNPDEVYQHIYENNTLSSITVKNRILNSMEILVNGKLALMAMTGEMLEETGALYSEGEQVINVPLTIRGVQASVLVKQNSHADKVKVSLRSRGDINVAEIAIAHGGGGHKNAAGYKSGNSFTETYQEIKQIMVDLVGKGS